MPATGTDQTLVTLDRFDPEEAGSPFGTTVYNTLFGQFRARTSVRSHTAGSPDGKWYTSISPNGTVRVGRSAYAVLGEARYVIKSGRHFRGRFQLESGRFISVAQEALLAPVLNAIVKDVAARMPDTTLIDLQDAYEAAKREYDRILPGFTAVQARLTTAMDALVAAGAPPRKTTTPIDATFQMVA